MPGANECDDGRRLHEIEMAVPTAEQSPDAVRERGGRTQGDKGVHVRAAALKLVPRAPEKARATDNHDRRGESEADPLEPIERAPAKNPFADNQRHREHRAEN